MGLLPPLLQSSGTSLSSSLVTGTTSNVVCVCVCVSLSLCLDLFESHVCLLKKIECYIHGMPMKEI